MIYLKQIISGGQTGADIGGLMGATELGLQTGGWIPRDFRNELGAGQWWLKKYNLKEHESSKYPPRTAQNVLDSDGTLVFTKTPELEGGSKLTVKICEKYKKPHYIINIANRDQSKYRVELLLRWLETYKIVILNVAGNRESKNPGIQLWVKNFLVESLTDKIAKQ